MALFFFIVGLEIKRAIVVGEISRIEDALFPILAAVRGMLLPTIIHFIINYGTLGAVGWPIPMATDIALALGVLALLDSRVPVSLKLFLSTLAIADDIGSVVVIATFFSTIAPVIPLIIGFVLIFMLVVLNRTGIHNVLSFAVLGVGVRLAFLLSGVHATLAGVIVAMTIPAIARVDTEDFCSKSHILLKDFEESKNLVKVSS